MAVTGRKTEDAEEKIVQLNEVSETDTTVSEDSSVNLTLS